MKTVRLSQLVYKQGSSDKAYEVEMCDVSSDGVSAHFVVNFRYGRRGTALREGTKTPIPVTRNEADTIFDNLVIAKLNNGYQDIHSVSAQEDSSNKPQPNPVNHSQSNHLSQSARYQGAVSRVKIGLADIASHQLDDKSAGRIIWRAGELSEAEFCPPMLRLLDGSSELLEYSLIWALGRCGDESIADKLLPLVTAARSDQSRRVAIWATISLSSEMQSKALLDSIAADLPDQLYSVINSINRLELRQAIDAYISVENRDCNNVLHQLYLLSFNKPDLRFALLKVLEQLSPKPNFFRGMRQVYKAAEFFKDAQVFGIISLRFDVNRSYYTSPAYGDYTFVPAANTAVRVSHEITKSDSSIAYSNKTRHYLRLRTWRSIRRMGELGLDDYVEMAMGILLSVRPEHKQEPRQTVQSDLNSGIRLIAYDEYAHLNALINIAFGSGTRYKLAGTRQAWQVNPDYSDINVREDKFPELWDRHPKALLQLLLESDLHPIQEFAAKALKEQIDFYDHITIDQLHILLSKPVIQTQELALTIAKSRYNPSQPDFKLVYLLLDSEYPQAVEQAKQWVNEQPRAYASSIDFLLWVVTANSQDTRHWCRTIVELADNDIDTSLLDSLFKWLLDLEAEALDSETLVRMQINDIEWVLLNPLKQACAQLPFDKILKLLAHPEPLVQVVAGRLLLNHNKPVEEIPPAVFTRLLESYDAEVRGIGVELFSKLPTEAIVSQPELVESFCVASEAQVRAGIRPAIARLAQVHQKDHQDYCQLLMRKLVDRLFRKESAEGVHDDLMTVLTTELAEVTATCSKELNWRLLRARSLAAQSLGIWLLDNREQSDFTVRQWAVIAHSDTLACREWAWRCYHDNPDTVVKHASDALRITDGKWEDTRQFAFDYFRHHFCEDAWQPELLMSICDSVRGDVQTFGRELLNRFFKEEHGEEYLLKLSQHPSSNVQLFASNYLDRFASGSVSRITALEQYFITVLSGVNKNRVSKNRITNFLLNEARSSEDVATLVARIFTRQSVTIAITDKAKYLIGMRDLTLQYPELELPLSIKKPKLHGANEKSLDTRVFTG